MLLVIDSCIKDNNSATRKLYESYLNEKNKDQDIKIVKLIDQGLKPYTIDDINKREQNLAEENFTDPMFEYANDFKNADQIIVAAPYWDLSFPSVFKELYRTYYGSRNNISL